MRGGAGGGGERKAIAGEHSLLDISDAIKARFSVSFPRRARVARRRWPPAPPWWPPPRAGPKRRRRRSRASLVTMPPRRTLHRAQRKPRRARRAISRRRTSPWWVINHLWAQARPQNVCVSRVRACVYACVQDVPQPSFHLSSNRRSATTPPTWTKLRLDVESKFQIE